MYGSLCVVNSVVEGSERSYVVVAALCECSSHYNDVAVVREYNFLRACYGDSILEEVSEEVESVAVLVVSMSVVNCNLVSLYKRSSAVYELFPCTDVSLEVLDSYGNSLVVNGELYSLVAVCACREDVERVIACGNCDLLSFANESVMSNCGSKLEGYAAGSYILGVKLGRNGDTVCKTAGCSCGVVCGNASCVGEIYVNFFACLSLLCGSGESNSEGLNSVRCESEGELVAVECCGSDFVFISVCFGYGGELAEELQRAVFAALAGGFLNSYDDSVALFFLLDSADYYIVVAY